MLQALYDKSCSLVGYIEKDRYIFDADMNWIAHIDRNQGWSATTNEWLGPVNGLICLDRRGLVVSWGAGQKLIGDPYNHRKPNPTPRIPSPPQSYLRPMNSTPPLPAAPIGGWSSLSFTQWIAQ